MNRILMLCIAAIFSVAYCTPAHGAIIRFGGQFTSGAGSLLGNLPPQSNFAAQLNFDATVPGLGNISSGTLTFSQLTLDISGGSIIVSDFGATDQATILFNTTGPTGSVSVSFFGNAISDSLVNEINLNALIRVGSPASISASFGSSGSYTGTVTAVPEPTSSALLGLSIAALGVGCRLRKRIKIDH